MTTSIATGTNRSFLSKHQAPSNSQWQWPANAKHPIETRIPAKDSDVDLQARTLHVFPSNAILIECLVTKKGGWVATGPLTEAEDRLKSYPSNYPWVSTSSFKPHVNSRSQNSLDKQLIKNVEAKQFCCNMRLTRALGSPERAVKAYSNLNKLYI